MTKMILTGDVNLMNVTDPAVPFSLVENEFRRTDIVFSNLECCLYRPPGGRSVEHEGFYADPSVAGEALKSAGIHAVGVANNVNYGEAAITGSIARLDEIGIAHTGAGANRAAARAPVDPRAGRGAVRVSAAQLGLLADQPRGGRQHRRHRGDPRAHRLSCPDARRPPAGQPAGHPARDRDLGRSGLSAMARRRHRRPATAGRHRRRVVSLGAARGSAPLHDRDRPPRNRRGRWHGHRPRARTSRCRSRCTRESRSSTGWAAFRSIPAMAAEGTATGSA